MKVYSGNHSAALCALAFVMALPVYASADSSAARKAWRLTGTLTQSGGAALLESEGEQRILYLGDKLEECALSQVSARAATFSCPEYVRHLVLDGITRDAPIAVLAGGSKPQQILLDRAEITGILGDRQKLVSSATFEPLVEASRLRGYRLVLVSPQSIAERAGFRTGDVLREVNGADLADTSASMQVLNNLAEVSELLVELERDGQRVRLDLLLQ